MRVLESSSNTAIQVVLLCLLLYLVQQEQIGACPTVISCLPWIVFNQETFNVTMLHKINFAGK